MSNQLSVRETKVMDAFALEGVKEQLNSLLAGNPKKIEAFKTRILKMSLSYGLDKCTPESIINCGIQALTLDLPLEAGQGYIVNYGGTASFDCGYKGWQVLAKRAGYSVVADVVYECDEFHQSGFGFDREIVFNPDHSRRNGSDDAWAKQNLTGVIVSILEDKTGNKTHAFVAADMIRKIIGMSPSAGKEGKGGKMYSPHDKWAEQMFAAKAIKQVLSKFPIDLAESQLAEAMGIVNNTEQMAQQAAASEAKEYPQERLDEMFPKWRELVEEGKKPAMAIITQLSNTYRLNPSQLEQVFKLKEYEPLEGEVANA
jgi:recombination protein RecT